MQMIVKNWRELIKPSKVDVEEKGRNKALIIMEPLERGFGLTLGNALRRILLSSLQGAAITSTKIEGILHEFSSIPGVREDVTEVILNLKTIAIKSHSPEKQRLQLKAEGPCVVTAGMIQENSNIEIISPDTVICTLENKGSLDMELTVETGKGYIPGQTIQGDGNVIGIIPVDAIFSPVTNVSYKVEGSRVGQVTDYDKLVMTVETNGAIEPRDAVGLAAKILQDQLQVFINFEEAPEEVKEVKEELKFQQESSQKS